MIQGKNSKKKNASKRKSQVPLNDGKSFLMLSVQIYIPLKENICMEKVSGTVKIINLACKGVVKRYQRTLNSLYLSACEPCSS